MVQSVKGSATGLWLVEHYGLKLGSLSLNYFQLLLEFQFADLFSVLFVHAGRISPRVVVSFV